MKEVRVAFVGAGGMAREHLSAFRDVPGVRLSGIHSRTRDRAEALAKEFGLPTVADSIPGLYERTRADLVVVAVPELVSTGVTLQCFELPWASLLEKPVGIDFDDAQLIRQAAERSEVLAMVGLNRRFYASTLAAKADLDSRDERRFITVHDQQSYEEARRYNHPEPIVERFMYANSVHNIDYLANFGRGDVMTVQPLEPWQGEATDVCIVRIVFSSGDVGMYHGIWRGPGPWACAISTRSKRWLMKPLEQAAYQNAGERQLQEVAVDELDQRYKAGFFRQACEAVAAVRGERNAAISLAESLRTHELIHRMFGV